MRWAEFHNYIQKNPFYPPDLRHPRLSAHRRVPLFFTPAIPSPFRNFYLCADQHPNKIEVLVKSRY
jgi:hypothetical protein